MRKKSELPCKLCLSCGKPFAWRKKWERDWDRVKYCSERCRAKAQPAANTALAPRGCPDENG